MAEARVAYFGSDNPLITPPVLNQHENARNYMMPPTGQFWFEPFAPEEVINLDKASLEARYGEGTEVIGGFVHIPGQVPSKDCSILIIGDIRHREENPFVDPEPGKGRNWMDTVIKGQDRAKDLAKLWSRYGVVLIKRELPTADEEREARQNRRMFANMIVRRAIIQVRQGTLGQKEGRIYFTDAEEAWAKEFGIRLPDLTGLDLPTAGEPGGRRERGREGKERVNA